MRIYQQLDQLKKLTECEILVLHIATYDLYDPEPQEDAEESVRKSSSKD